MNKERVSDRVTICLPTETRKRLKVIAATADCSISEYIRFMIDAAIEMDKKAKDGIRQ